MKQTALVWIIDIQLIFVSKSNQNYIEFESNFDPDARSEPIRNKRPAAAGTSTGHFDPDPDVCLLIEIQNDRTKTKQNAIILTTEYIEIRFYIGTYR